MAFPSPSIPAPTVGFDPSLSFTWDYIRVAPHFLALAAQCSGYGADGCLGMHIHRYLRNDQMAERRR